MKLFKAAELGPPRGLVLTNAAPAPGAIPLKIEKTGAAKAPPATPKTAVSAAAPSAAPAVKNEVSAEPSATGGAAQQQPAGATVSASVDDTYWKLPDADQINFRVNFAFDSSAIDTKQKPGLKKLCDVITEMNIKLVRIIGHTDGTGTAAYNQSLSTLRAKEVAHFFEEDCHIPRERLEPVGVGMQFLLNPSNPKADENRRVEFQAAS